MSTLSQRLRATAPFAFLFSIAALAEAVGPVAAEILPLTTGPAPEPATWQLVLLSRSTAILDTPMDRAACIAAAQGFQGIVVRAACVDTATGATVVF